MRHESSRFAQKSEDQLSSLTSPSLNCILLRMILDAGGKQVTHYRTPGEPCALRGIFRNKVWLVQSVIVVKDEPAETVLLLLPGAQCVYPAGYARWRVHDQSGLTRWEEALSDHLSLTQAWETNRILIFLEPEKYYSCFLFWNQKTDQFVSYYINFQLPYRRSHCGFDTLDLDLDIVIEPDYQWKWKDVDEYELGIRQGGIRKEWVRGIEASKTEVFDRISRRKYPLDDSWLSWRPDPSWLAPALPPDWQVL